MICPNCWTKVQHLDSDISEPEMPEDYRLPKNAQAKELYTMEMFNAAHAVMPVETDCLIVAGQPRWFEYVTHCSVSIRKNFRVRMQQTCENCHFVWDYFGGDEDLETYKLSPDQKFHLILWPILAFFLATVLCSAVWAYHWKQVKMAENGLEKVEVPGAPTGTVTEWRKVKSVPEKEDKK